MIPGSNEMMQTKQITAQIEEARISLSTQLLFIRLNSSKAGLTNLDLEPWTGLRVLQVLVRMGNYGGTWQCVFMWMVGNFGARRPRCYV